MNGRSLIKFMHLLEWEDLKKENLLLFIKALVNVFESTSSKWSKAQDQLFS